MIQLSLFPARGYALLLRSPWNELAIDHSGEPKVFTTRRQARAAFRRQPEWIQPATAIVVVEVHPPADPARDLPTFLIL